MKETESLDINLQAADAPFEQNHGMNTKEENAKVDKVQYQRLVRKLTYLANTRLDLAYVVSVVLLWASSCMFQERDTYGL